jgi:acyl carrier protein
MKQSKRIALTATFAAEPVRQVLEFWLKDLGFGADLQFSADLSDPASLVSIRGQDITVVLVRFEDWLQARRSGIGPGVATEKSPSLERGLRAFAEAVRLDTPPAARLLICLCPAFGPAKERQVPPVERARLENLLRTELASLETCTIVPKEELASGGADSSTGAEADNSTDEILLFASVGTAIARRLADCGQTPARVLDVVRAVGVLRQAKVKNRDRYVLDTPFVAPRTPAEEDLARIWTEVLEVDRVGVDDNFFELGGDSLLATILSARVAESMGASITVETLAAASTIADLVGRLGTASDRAAGATDCVVTMRTGRGRRTLFLFPAASGQSFPYTALARAMDPETAVQAFRSPELSPGAPLANIEETVATYTRRLRELQPSGPYFVGGWSHGSVLAFEAAKRLQQQGAEVASVIMLDPPSPQPPRHAVNPARLARIASWLALHAPALGKLLPGIGKRFASTSTLERFMIGLPLPIEGRALMRLLKFALPAAECPAKGTLERMSHEQLCDLMVEGIRRRASEADLRRYFIPGLSPTELVQAAQVWKHDLLLGATYRADPTVVPLRIDVFAGSENDSGPHWQAHTSDRVVCRSYPIRAVRELSPHLAFVEAENIELFRRDLVALLDEATARPQTSEPPATALGQDTPLRRAREHGTPEESCC